MPESNSVTIPSAKCDVDDSHPGPSSEPIQLCIFKDPVFGTPSAMFRRTIEYTRDPSLYLRNYLGADVFAERRPLLSIPETIDRDAYGTGYHKDHFEKHVANLLGKTHGLFFITGVQAQLVGLKIYCTRAGNSRVSWHVTSHLEASEEQAYEHLYGLDRTLVGDDPSENPPVEEIVRMLSLPEGSRPTALVLEIPNRTLGCKTYTFAELERISDECRKANVKLHCDGARIWEVEPYYQETAGKTFQDLGNLFDSVYVSFYKGLGGAGGAMLVSNDATFINEAKIWQRRAGGNVFTLTYQVADDERGYNENIGSFRGKWKKMEEIVREVNKATAGFKNRAGGPIVNFVPAQPTCAQIHTLFEGFTADELSAARDRVQAKTNIQVFVRLRAKQTVDESSKTARDAKLGGGDPSNALSIPDSESHFMEWMIVDPTHALETDVFVNGYVALCEELLARRNISA